MRVADSHYLVRMDQGRDTRNGVELADVSQYLLPFSGTVVASPERLYFPIEEYARAKADPALFIESSAMFSDTCEHLGPIVPKGSKCLFSYLANNEPDVDHYGRKMKVIHHNYMVAYYTRRGVLVPVNNWVIVRMEESDSLSKGHDSNDYGSAVVVASSVPVVDFHLGHAPSMDIFPGDRVSFLPKMAARFEKDHLNTMNPDGQSSLFRVQRKYITHVFEK